MQRQILLIEDDPENAAYVELALTVKGYGVTVAGNAEEALVLLDRGRPDLVLLDVMLPGMSGFELLTHLRGRPALAPLPVIVLTALAQQWDFEQALKLGVNDYLTKPFEPRELVERIERALAGGEGQGE